MAMNIKFTELLGLLAVDLAESTNSEEYLSSDWVDISQYNWVRGLGGISAASGCTLTVRIRSATDDEGTDAAVEETSTLYLPLGADRDAIAVAEVRTDQFPSGSYFAQVQVMQDSGGAESLDCILMGGEPVEKPVDEGDELYTGTPTPS